MAKIAYILLCHKDPDAVIDQALRLTSAGDYISIHFDARARPEDFTKIDTALRGNDRVVFAKRIKCGWGEWSLIQATLNAIVAAEEAFPRASHFYMLSGDCMPIKSASYIHEFLDSRRCDFIESFDFFASGWIKTGMKEERLIYRHFFNERKNKPLFYGAMELQKKLGLAREIPDDLHMMIGSQWWCLRRRTIEKLLEFTRKRKDVMRFFRTTWIPDETFFQTLVRHLVPADEIDGRTLTFLMFSDYGMPATFYNDQYDLLISQNYLFARKISPEAGELKTRLGELFASGQTAFNNSNEGRGLHKYLTLRGREGRRFAPRFWERENTLGRERELMIIVCKKWHVAKRLLRATSQVTGIEGIEYLFDEGSTDLPDLGGLASTMEKRSRHRRAMLRMLFDFNDTNKLLICLDPNNMTLLKDIDADRSTTRILEVDCDYDEAYLKGHAMRTGLAGDHTPHETMQSLLPTIRHDFDFESEALRDAQFKNFYRMRQSESAEANALALQKFLDVSPEKAQKIAQTNHLFEG